MDKSKKGAFFGIFFLLGIYINNLTENFCYSLFFLALVSIIFLGVIFVKKSFIHLTLIFIISFSSGIYLSEYNLEKTKIIGTFLGNIKGKQYITIEISKINKITDDKIVYIGKTHTIGNYRLNSPLSAEIHIQGTKKLEIGDIISFQSKIYNYEPIENFKYDKYMYSNKIFFKTYPYNYEVVDKKEINAIKKTLITTREKILSNIKEIYPLEESIFLGGILVGAREDMPIQLKENFNNSGLTHIIAVSGFNITIIVLFLSYIFKYFPPFFKATLISIIIVLFTLLVGANPPVVRAAIMGIVGYYIISSGRKGNTINILIFTACIMSIFSPLSLNYDVSFQLSFLAVLGITLTNDSFQKLFKNIPNVFEIKEALCLTLSSLVFTLPILAFNFGQVSIVSPITNILVAWSIPLIMLVSTIGLVFYIFSPFLGIFISYFAWVLLKWDITVINIFGEWKYSVIKYDFGKYTSILGLVYFIIIFFIIYSRKKKLF